MRSIAGRKLMRRVPALVLCALLLFPASVLAAPTVGTPEQIEAKKAEKAAALAEMAAARTQLAMKTSEFIEGAKQLQRVRVDVSEVTTQLAEIEGVVERSESALASRAVELYRGDRLSMLSIMLSAESVVDLMERANYLASITDRDARLLVDLRHSRAQTAWLKSQLDDRLAKLEALQIAADSQTKQIEAAIAAQQARATALDQDLAELLTPVAVYSGANPTSDFNPNTLISDSNYRAATSMSVADIQTFLDSQPGRLARYRAKDHNGNVHSAAEMIAEAATGWGVSPKVILATLQKEQSLLTDKSLKRSQLDWAMGCGKGDSYTSNKYQGFGKQIWFGASKLDKNAAGWSLGKTRKIDGSVLQMTNSSTWSLYMYTPHLPGANSFWLIYWRYFGDPLAEAGAVP